MGFSFVISSSSPHDYLHFADCSARPSHHTPAQNRLHQILTWPATCCCSLQRLHNAGGTSGSLSRPLAVGEVLLSFSLIIHACVCDPSSCVALNMYFEVTFILITKHGFSASLSWYGRGFKHHLFKHRFLWLFRHYLESNTNAAATSNELVVPMSYQNSLKYILVFYDFCTSFLTQWQELWISILYMFLVLHGLFAFASCCRRWWWTRLLSFLGK